MHGKQDKKTSTQPMKGERTAMHMSGKGKKWGMLGFPRGSVGKESACNARGLGSIPE